MVTAKDPPSEHTNPSADDSSTSLAGTGALAAGELTEDAAFPGLSESLGLTVEHPATGVCVMTVHGELDMVTTPLLEICLREQLDDTNLAHLVVDLQAVCFLGSSGLNCLLRIRDDAQSTATQLHLAGLVTRAVARPLQVTQLADSFNTYPTVTDALTGIID